MVLGGPDEVRLEGETIGSQVIGSPEGEVVRRRKARVGDAADCLIDASKAFHS